jgi:phosphohistidine phosphatase
VKIYFMRHGEAEDKVPGAEDTQRPLTSRGAAITSNTARSLKKEMAGVDIIFTSPMLRAAQTADIFANTLGCKGKTVSTEALLVGTHPDEIIKEIKRRKGLKNVLITGHQPHIGICVSFLTGVGEEKLMVKKGSCLLVETDDPGRGKGRLMWTRGPVDI